MDIRVLFIDDGGQRRLLVVYEIGQSENGNVWIENDDYYYESVNTISDSDYKDLVEFAMIHGYVDLTTIGQFNENSEL